MFRTTGSLILTFVMALLALVLGITVHLRMNAMPLPTMTVIEKKVMVTPSVAPTATPSAKPVQKLPLRVVTPTSTP